MTLTLQLPDEYAAFLPSKASDMAAVISAGLRSWQGRKAGEIQALDDVIDTLADLPSAQEVLALHPSQQLAERITVLLEKNRRDGLSESEQAEWGQIMRVEHLVRIAKARARAKLQAA
jgi:hypothetical protein